jgi:hypothetical protein
MVLRYVWRSLRTIGNMMAILACAGFLIMGRLHERASQQQPNVWWALALLAGILIIAIIANDVFWSFRRRSRISRAIVTILEQESVYREGHIVRQIKQAKSTIRDTDVREALLYLLEQNKIEKRHIWRCEPEYSLKFDDSLIIS